MDIYREQIKQQRLSEKKQVISSPTQKVNDIYGITSYNNIDLGNFNLGFGDLFEQRGTVSTIPTISNEYKNGF